MSNTVEVFINGSENVSGAIAKVKAALESLKDEKVTIEIDVDKSAADKAIKGLKDDADGIGKKVDLEIDTSKARKKLDRLLEKKKKFEEATRIELDAGPANSKLDRLHEKKNKFSEATKIELDAGPANSKLDRLAQKKDKIFGDSTKLEVDTDDAKSKLKELADNTQSIRIDIDADGVIEDIEDINLALESLDERKTINIEVDAGGALAKIAAVDAALNGIDDQKSKVDVDVDVDDLDLIRMQSELKALERNRDKVSIGIETNLVVDEDRIKELQDRIAEKQRIRIKAEVDDSELVESGLRDKKVTIEAVVKGMARVEMLHRLISQINDKTVTITVNTNNRELSTLTGNGKGSLGEPVTKDVTVRINEASLNRYQRALRDRDTSMNERGQGFLDAEIESATNNLKDYKNTLRYINNDMKNITKASGAFDRPYQMKLHVNDDELKKLENNLAKMFGDRDVLSSNGEAEARRLIQLTKMRSELEGIHQYMKSIDTLNRPTTGENGLVQMAARARSLRKEIEDLEKTKTSSIGVPIEIENVDKQIAKMQKKIADRKNSLSPFKNIDISNEALKGLKNKLKDTNITIRTIVDSTDQMKNLRKQMKDIEKNPINLRTPEEKENLRNLTKELKNLQKVRQSMGDLNSSLFDRKQLQENIKSIKAARTQINTDAIRNPKAELDVDIANATARINSLTGRDVTVDVDVDTATAESRLATLSRPRSTTMNAVINSRQIQTITRIFNDIGESASRNGRRISDSFGDDRVFGRGLRNISRFSDGINKGIGAMTNRIPVVGSLFSGLGKLGGIAGSATTSLAGMAGAGPKVAGALGGVTQAVISVTSALAGLGVIGAVGTGAITAGAYVAQAALGTVAGVVGAVGAAIGGAFIGGFAYLVKDVPMVQEAYTKLGDSVSTSMKKLAEPVAAPIANLAPKLQSAFDTMAPSIDRIAQGTANLVTQMGDKLQPVAKELGPAMESAFDFGAKSLNSLMDNMPAITKAVGGFFDKLGGPEVSKAVNGAFAAIPGIIGGIGTGIEKASEGFNNLQKFMSSDTLDPMREGFEKFKESFTNTDWSSANEGITNAMNGFGNFVGSIDMQNVSDGIGSVATGLGNLGDVAAEMNFDGIFAGLAKGFEKVSGGLPEFASSLLIPIKPVFDIIGGAADVIGSVIDTISNGTTKAEVNIPIAVEPEATFDSGAVENMLGPDIAKALEGNNNITEVKVPINALPQIIDGADKATLGSISASLKDLNLPPVPMEFPVEAAPRLAGSNTGLIDTATLEAALAGDITGPLKYEVPVEVMPQLLAAGLITPEQFMAALGGAPPEVALDILVRALPQLLPGGGLTPQQLSDALFTQGEVELPFAVNAIPQLINNRSLSASEIGAAIGDLPPLQKEVVINALFKLNAEGKIDDSQLQAIIDSIGGEQPIIDQTAQVNVTLGAVTGLDMGQVNAMIEDARGDDTITIQKEVMVELQKNMGLEGLSGAELIGEIESRLSEAFGRPIKIEAPVEFNPKPTLGDGNGAGGIMGDIGSQIQGQIGAAAGAGIEANVPVTVNAQIKGVEDVSAKIKESIAYKGGAAEVQTQQIRVQLIPDGSALAGVLAAGYPMRVTIVPDLSGIAGLLGAGVPMRVILVPDISGLAGLLGAGVPMRVIIIPDLSALGALTIPPIRVPVIVDSPVVPMPMISPLRIPTAVDMPIVPIPAVPPIRIPVVIDMPAIPTIPNTTSTHTVQVTAPPIPPYPSTTSTHTVSMIAPASTPSYPNTSSTHTVNIVVNGSLPGGGGSSSIRSAAMGAMNSMTSAARGIGAMGASIPMAAPSMSGGGRGVATIRRTGQAISESIGAGILAGKDSIDKAVNEVGQSVGAIGPQIDKYLTDNSPEYAEAKKIGGELAKNITDGINSAQGQIGQAMEGINKVIADPIGEIDKILSANVPGYDVAKQQVEGFVSNVEKTMSGLEAAAKVGSEGFQKIIAEEFVLPPMDQLEAKAREIGDGIGAALMGDPSKLSATMDGIGQTMGAKLATVATKVDGVMGQINQTMRDKVPGFADAQDAAIGFGQGIIQSVDTARTQINEGLSSMGLPTIPTPQMAIDGLNTEINKAKTALATGFMGITPPTIPTPQMAAEGIMAEAAKVKSAIDGALAGAGIKLPVPTLPAPDLGAVKSALSGIPGAVETINRVESDVSKAQQGLKSIPDAITTENTVEGNIAAVVSQIKSLAGMNTTSTHTIKVQTLGGDGGTSARSASMSAAMGAGPMGMARGAAMPMGASASSSFSLGFDIGSTIADQIKNARIAAEKELSAMRSSFFKFFFWIGNFGGSGGIKLPDLGESLNLEGWKPSATLEHGLGQFIGKLEQKASTIGQTMNSEINKYLNLDVRGAYSEGLQNKLRAQMKAFSIDGYSYGAGEASNHYYYQTVNNSFDGGLVGDPELQAKRVLEVLESTPSSRRYRQQGSVG